MAIAAMELFSDAKNNWDLEALYADIASTEGHELTEWEKICLRGLLCRHTPTFIASQIFWTAPALRTELSRRVYPIISNLIDRKGIKWKKGKKSKIVSDVLEDAGYKNPPLHILQSDLLNLETRATQNLQDRVVRASVIIASVRRQLRRDSESTTLRANDISSLNNLIEQGNDQQKQDNFSNAINFYRAALLIESSRTEVLIQIARCFDRLRLYRDSLFICDFALFQLENNEHQSLEEKNKQKSQVYNFLAGVFHELALHNYRESYVTSAVSLYQKALYYAPFDLVPSWNILDLFMSLSKHKEIISGEREYYVSRAKLALYTFKSTAHLPDFNFKSCRKSILKDAELASSGLDKWWREQLNELNNFGW